MLPILTTIDSYSRMGDVGVIALTCLVFILLGCSYVNRDKSYRIFSAIIGVILLAAICNIGYHELLRVYNPSSKIVIYVLRMLYNAFMYDVFFLFTLYATVISNMKKKHARIAAIVSNALFIVFVALDIVFTITGIGFSIKDDGTATQTFNIFMVGYAIYVIFLALLIVRVRKLVYKRVVIGISLTLILSVIIRVTQMFLNEASLNTMVFMIPALSVLYFMHLNPYNITTGTLNKRAMEEMIKSYYIRNKEFIIMSLQLPDFVGEGKSLPEVVLEQTRRFNIKYFRDGTLFQIGNGQIIMIASKSSNPDYEDWMKTILDAFEEQYNIYKMPYKIVYGESLQDKINNNEYIGFIDSIHVDIPECTTHRISLNDVKSFNNNKYIVEQLRDIAKTGDLNDPRVLVYTQPVFNINTKCFDTAEALMRLRLDKTGLIGPGLFIPVAESIGCIHTLTKIILNKTCKKIHELIEEGRDIERISVNVSIVELRSHEFCQEIIDIIKANDIPSSKIAIELTESQNEAEFMIMKEKIQMLHKQGIKFYLDDFGTGYSNMERILELPFDIIKFDRSMVIASGLNKRSEKMVENLAKMFEEFKYRVLYEGVETISDENRCLTMAASYLQGFKYSQPIPIEQLNTFLSNN